MVLLVGLVAASWAADRQCTFTVDGAPVERLDCEAGGAWKVVCALPGAAEPGLRATGGPSGKVRVRLSTHGFEAEARVPLSERGEIVLPVGGPGGRAGAFLVDRPAVGLLAGQAIGPNQLCPFVQPDVPPGSPRVERPLSVTVTVHQQIGFAEETLDGGVINRVPTYDAGVSFASGEVPALQRRVGDVPVLVGTTGLPKDEALRGQLQVADPAGTWRSLQWTGRVAEVPLDASVLQVLVLDLAAPEIAAATGAEPAVWVEEDLERWLKGDLSSLLGLAAFAKSGLHVPHEGLLADAVVDGKSWRRLATERADVRVGRFGDRLRVAIAWQPSPLGPDAVRAIDAAFDAP